MAQHHHLKAVKNSTVRHLTLENGRTIEWHEYGITDGSHTSALLYCHGTPGSGLEAQVFDQVARDEGVLVLAPDRPGVGGSDRLDARPVIDWGQDAATLLDERGVSQCAVIGYSGGAPYALAVAVSQPDLVEKVGLLAPFTHQNSISKRIDLTTAPAHISLQRFSYRLLSAPTLHRGASGALRQLNHLSRSDSGLVAALNADMDGELYLQHLMHSHLHAMQDSTQGTVDDLTAIHSPWGFSLGSLPRDIEFSVWVGSRDRVTSVQGAKDLAERLQGNLHELKGYGHTALFALAAPDALKDLVGQQATAS